MYDLKDFQIEISKTMAWLIAVELIVLLISLYLLYLVIKYAIRDGIDESKLARTRWTDSVNDPAMRDAVRATKDAAKVLPPMRAD